MKFAIEMPIEVTKFVIKSWNPRMKFFKTNNRIAPMKNQKKSTMEKAHSP
jgi:hypothetical protein